MIITNHYILQLQLLFELEKTFPNEKADLNLDFCEEKLTQKNHSFGEIGVAFDFHQTNRFFR